jgi:hypothetical protein
MNRIFIIRRVRDKLNMMPDGGGHPVFISSAGRSAAVSYAPVCALAPDQPNSPFCETVRK